MELLVSVVYVQLHWRGWDRSEQNVLSFFRGAVLKFSARHYDFIQQVLVFLINKNNDQRLQSSCCGPFVKLDLKYLGWRGGCHTGNFSTVICGTQRAAGRSQDGLCAAPLTFHHQPGHMQTFPYLFPV